MVENRKKTMRKAFEKPAFLSRKQKWHIICNLNEKQICVIHYAKR